MKPWGGDLVKIRIEIEDGVEDMEVVIRCGSVDNTVLDMQNHIASFAFSKPSMTFYKQNQQYYFPLESILFFETEGEHIYAHTDTDEYLIKYRLYELEKILPRYFTRVSKSSIVNVQKIYSITRNITSSSLIKFVKSHKQLYVSRRYYSALRQLLDERSSYER